MTIYQHNPQIIGGVSSIRTKGNYYTCLLRLTGIRILIHKNNAPQITEFLELLSTWNMHEIGCWSSYQGKFCEPIHMQFKIDNLTTLCKNDHIQVSDMKMDTAVNKALKKEVTEMYSPQCPLGPNCDHVYEWSE